jgi:RNA polymerase sigma-70 factor (ECF subfamily)
MLEYFHNEVRACPAQGEARRVDALDVDTSSFPVEPVLERADGLCDNWSPDRQRRAMETLQEQAINTELAALVTRIQCGDATALAALYDATASRLYALALRVVGDRSAAEEIVSDVYLQVWDQAGRYDPLRGRVLAWMMMMCRSRALDLLRRRDPAVLHPDPTLLCVESAPQDDDPLDILLALERDSAIAKALALLGVRERSLLSLAFFRGLTHQEIATQTGMPLGTIKTALRRAMQTMRPVLERTTIAVRENP